MKVTAHEISLTQRHLWRSAREAIPVQHALIVEVEQDGVTGFGEASAFMTNHYNSGLEQLHGDLRRVAPCWPGCAPTTRLPCGGPGHRTARLALRACCDRCRCARSAGPTARRAAVAGPRTGPAPGLRSSFSIGLDKPEVMVRKLRERLGWSARDKARPPCQLAILRQLRRHTDAPFYVDGNCGWELFRLLPVLDELAALGVSLIEQPFPRAAWDDARILKRYSPIPVIADESITSRADLDSCTEAFHGINVKPMKAGGITPSLALLRAARERGLITMLGCMPESAAGVSATAHLGTLADHLDVDVVDLLAVDTGQGLTLDSRGAITVPDRPGSGYLPDPAALGWRVRPVPAAEVWPIRHEVLRPGQPVESSGYAEDDRPGARHFAALHRGRPVGAASVYHEDPPAEFVVPGLNRAGVAAAGHGHLDEIAAPVRAAPCCGPHSPTPCSPTPGPSGATPAAPRQISTASTGSTPSVRNSRCPG